MSTSLLKPFHFPVVPVSTPTTLLKARSFATERGKKKLIVLGTGWAGFRTILDIDLKLYDINVISPRNHFIFTPLLTSTTVGTLEFRGVIEPIRTARKHLNYVQATVKSIDFENKCVHAESVYEQKESDEDPGTKLKISMKYDQLVIAVGASPNTFNVPGTQKYCFFLKELSDARAIRNRIVECFERASNPNLPEEERLRLLHFVVIGGGPTSVEFTAELYDFLTQDVHKWFPDLENKVQVTLIEAGKKLLGSFDEKLSEYTMRLFNKRKVDIRTNISVKEVKRHHIILTDGTQIPFGMAVWSTGLTANSLVKSLPVTKDKQGRIIVDDHLRIKYPPMSDVYAIGDCAAFETNPLPPTAQVAEQQGKFVARELNQKAYGKTPKSFLYRNRGMLAYVGGSKSVADTPVWKKSGFLAWLFWNAAYITKLVSIRNKIMIPMYWFKQKLFGRDISRF